MRRVIILLAFSCLLFGLAVWLVAFIPPDITVSSATVLAAGVIGLFAVAAVLVLNRRRAGR